MFSSCNGNNNYLRGPWQGYQTFWIIVVIAVVIIWVHYYTVGGNGCGCGGNNGCGCQDNDCGCQNNGCY